MVAVSVPSEVSVSPARMPNVPPEMSRLAKLTVFAPPRLPVRLKVAPADVMVGRPWPTSTPTKFSALLTVHRLGVVRARAGLAEDLDRVAVDRRAGADRRRDRRVGGDQVSARVEDAHRVGEVDGHAAAKVRFSTSAATWIWSVPSLSVMVPFEAIVTV